MITVNSLKFELEERLQSVAEQTGKTHISVRWEPQARIVRVGACIDRYNWDSRMSVLKTLLDFERDHADELAIEFDIIPLDSVRDEEFAEA